jgi:hypothetical protein
MTPKKSKNFHVFSSFSEKKIHQVAKFETEKKKKKKTY